MHIFWALGQLPALALSAIVLPEDQVCDREDQDRYKMFRSFSTLSTGAGDSKSTDCSQPITQANEAYGLLPTSVHSPLSN